MRIMTLVLQRRTSTALLVQVGAISPFSSYIRICTLVLYNRYHYMLLYKLEVI
jgi:hypothetical protein